MPHRIVVAAHATFWFGFHLLMMGESALVALGAGLMAVNTDTWNAVAIAFSTATCTVLTVAGPPIIKFIRDYRMMMKETRQQVSKNTARIDDVEAKTDQTTKDVASLGEAGLILKGDAKDRPKEPPTP